MQIATLILQILCIIAVGAGIAIEFHYEADLGFVFITAGAFAFALSEKLDKRRIKRYIRNGN
jgi:hypothetical protein